MTDINKAEFWDEAYREHRDGWDIGAPTPVFQDILQSTGLDLTSIGGIDYRNAPSPPVVAVPCSGRGHDALLFARYGFEVAAIDFSGEAMKYLKAVQPPPERLTIVQTDLFNISAELYGYFDLIVEYTCICAIDPSRRDELIASTRAVLKPGGYALTLLFPIDGRPGGPPFAIDVEEWRRRMSPYFDLTFEVTPTTSVKPRLNRERLMMWKKKPSTQTV